MINSQNSPGGIRASIDIGSNSVLLLVGEFKQQKFIEIESEAEVTGLGRGIEKNKVFSSEAMNETEEVLRRYGKIIKGRGLKVEETLLTATEASRISLNAGEFFNKIEKEIGFRVQIISSKWEAYYSALGVVLGLPTDQSFESMTILDLGGASTELIKVQIKPFKVLESLSLPVGSVRSTEWIKEGIFQENFSRILFQYGTELDSYQGDNLTCIAGTMTSFAAFAMNLESYADKLVNGQTFDRESFLAIKNKLDHFDDSKLNERFPYLGKRIPTLRAGINTVFDLAEHLRVKKYLISTFGLRHGTLYEGFLPATK